LRKINIAIDGPAGAGKSTIAKIIAESLKITYLDTGAMYRAVALKAIRNGIDTKDEDSLVKMLEDTDISISYEQNNQIVYLDGEDVTKQIRTPDVSIGASNVAVVPQVRIKMVELQRKIAEERSVVMDGRDIGTYVLPNADVKIFLTASVEVRARRRYNELLEKGTNNISYDDVLKDVIYRDKNDSSRDFAPLKKAEDAIEIDTTELNIDEVVEKIKNIIKEIS